MSAKHTRTPWLAQGHGEVRTEHGVLVTGLAMCADARFIVASVNSYAAHCKDPVAAAESDLLGRAVELLREVISYWDEYQCRAAACGAGCEHVRARALLAETKEGA